MTAIVCVSQSWGIGRDGALLFRISADHKRFRTLTVGKTVILGIRPEDIYEEADAIEGGFAENSVDVEETVVTREMLGSEVILYFDEQNRTCAVRLKPTNQTQAGEKIRLYFDMDRAHVFDMETEENLLYRKEW